MRGEGRAESIPGVRQNQGRGRGKGRSASGQCGEREKDWVREAMTPQSPQGLWGQNDHWAFTTAEQAATEGCCAEE